MKKVKFNKKLSLNKEAITKLNEANLINIKGGGVHSLTCYSKCANCAPPITTNCL